MAPIRGLSQCSQLASIREVALWQPNKMKGKRVLPLLLITPLTELPITPQKILKVLEKQRGGAE